MVEAYRYLVEALVAQERLDDASELVAFAARNLPEEDAYARSSLLLAEAIVATASGEPSTASTAFAEALRLIEELDMPLELADARMALGLSLRAFGDATGARAELERARAMFVRIGATMRRDAIDRELAELGGGAGSRRPLHGVAGSADRSSRRHVRGDRYERQASLCVRASEVERVRARREERRHIERPDVPQRSGGPGRDVA